MSEFVKKLYAWCLNKVRFVAGSIRAFLPRVLPDKKKSIAFLKRVFFFSAVLLLACPVILRVGGASALGIPNLSNCTATYVILDDGNGDWRIKFTSSGTWTPTKTITIDVFAVGGGAGGGVGRYGGCGGYTTTQNSVVLQAGVAYAIVVGAGGAVASVGNESSAFGVTASGGGTYGGGSGGGAGSSWTSSAGGNGGSDGSDGADVVNSSTNTGRSGQGTTTREFGESTGDLYAGAGGGGTPSTSLAGGTGGSGGGGRGGNAGTITPFAGTANTGGGGGGGSASGVGAQGGSGICVIRNHREAA